MARLPNVTGLINGMNTPAGAPLTMTSEGYITNAKGEILGHLLPTEDAKAVFDGVERSVTRHHKGSDPCFMSVGPKEPNRREWSLDNESQHGNCIERTWVRPSLWS